MFFYKKIDILCDLKQVSRRKMCEEINLSYNTFNSMLRRQSSNITLDVIESIAKFFGVSIDYLVRDEITDPLYNGSGQTKKKGYPSIAGMNENGNFLPNFYKEKNSDTVIFLDELSPEGQKKMLEHFEMIKKLYRADNKSDD